MKLTKIELTNFRKFNHLVLELHDGKNEIQAPNRYGKTTIADAIAFVLFGKLNDGSSDLASIKPANDTRLIVTAELTFSTEWNNPNLPSELRFKKEYGELWSKVRGENYEVMKGHFTNNFINDQAKSVTEYQNEVCSIFKGESQKMLQIISSPLFFSENLKWEERREILLKIIGEIMPEEIFAKAPILKRIQSDLANAMFNVDNLKNTINRKLNGAAKDDKTSLRYQKQDYESQIKGLQSENPVSEDDFTKAAVAVSSNERTILDLREKKKGENNPVLESLEKELGQKKQDLLKSELDDMAIYNAENQKISGEFQELDRQMTQSLKGSTNVEIEIDGLKRDKKRYEDSVSENEIIITNKRSTYSDLRTQYTKNQERKFIPPVDSHCPNCGYDLGQEANQKEEEKFNLDKANRSKELIDEAKQVNKRIEELILENKNAQEKIEEIKEKILSKQEELNKFNSNFIELSNKKTEKRKEQLELLQQDSDKTLKLRKEIQEFEEKIRLETLSVSTTSDIDNEIQKLQEANAKLRETIDLYNAQKINRKTSEQCEKSLAVVIQDISDNENKLDLLKQYRKIRVEIMKERIKETFGDIEFKLVEENITADSWNEVCYVMDKTPNGDIPFERTNSESKFKIGISIIEAIKKFFKMENIPIVIDNAESITKSNRIFNTTSQTICFIADEK